MMTIREVAKAMEVCMSDDILGKGNCSLHCPYFDRDNQPCSRQEEVAKDAAYYLHEYLKKIA